MSQEHSAPSNPKEDVPSMTQQTPRVAPQSLPPFPLFGEGNPVVHTLARYWRLFNDPGLTPRAPNLGSSVKGIRTKDRNGESSLSGSPFIPKIQDRPIL
ncbi:hypothetical protein GW17_00057904 [Ensete ventricosum]|nr:hypothetical protein GW17_00057904 [Ensete ventricosum]RZR98317.1 hypothetical protein BHM03_00027637 [Ensete ventricosum]